MLKFLTLICFLAINSALSAQTTVYVCTSNGAYGYCYGNKNTSGCAYNECIKHGGKTPSVILSHSGKGHGAIAIGKGANGEQIVGASAGYSNSSGAIARAKQECAKKGGKGIYIDKTFFDDKEKEEEKEESTKKKKVEDDFWNGKEEKTSSSNKSKSDFWDGKGSRSEEADFDANTISKESNQFIGEIESRTKRIKIVCNDHGTEDGDRVQIRNNKKIIKSNLYLTNAKKTIFIELNFGMNRLDFKALNQGSLGANTARFDIYDDSGRLISSKEWNLLTGFTGTLLIVKL